MTQDLTNRAGLNYCGRVTEAFVNVKRTGYTAVAIDTRNRRLALLAPQFEDPKSSSSARTGTMIQLLEIECTYSRKEP